MMLEEIAAQYGMNDYFDMCTGRIYQLSNATDDGKGNLFVPIIDACGDNILLGYARMRKQ